MPNIFYNVSLGMNLFLLRINKENYNRKFIYSLLKRKEKYIKNLSSGTSTKTITKDDIKTFEILVPISIIEQQKNSRFSL